MENNQFKETLCPVCKNFYFSSLSDIEKQEGVDWHQFYCHNCGWKYSLEQLENPCFVDKDGKNIDDYKKDYAEKIKNNPTYCFQDEDYNPKPHLCPVCEKHKFSDVGSYETCPVCGWEDDEVMESEPDKWEGSANDLCLNDYRKRYIENL